MQQMPFVMVPYYVFTVALYKISTSSKMFTVHSDFGMFTTIKH